ncbi:MAG: hypothetical protein OHK0022_53520 [Roseiflexaceae bacterium]
MSNTDRSTGQTRDTGFQVGVRRTLSIPPADAWQLLTSQQGARLWLGDLPEAGLAQGVSYRLEDGTSGAVTVFEPGSHLRLTWQPPGWARPSVIQVRVLPSGERTTVAFHQEHLPSPAEREQRRAFYTSVLDQLRRITNN